MSDIKRYIFYCDYEHDAYEEEDPDGQWVAYKDIDVHLSNMEKLTSDLKEMLALAINALGEAVYLLNPTEADMEKRSGVYNVVTTLEELKRTRR